MKKIILFSFVSGLLVNCGGFQVLKSDATVDLGGAAHHSVSDLVGGVWVDGNGCEHWMIDDGIEGYMTTRWGSDGKPYCPEGNIPYTTKNFKRTTLGQNSLDLYNK